MNEKNIARLLMDIKAVLLRPKKPFKYVSGALGPIYCDGRLLISYPKERSKIIGAMTEIIKAKNLNFDTVAGIATSGIPHAAWLSDKTNKPMVYIRKAGKGHGTQKLVEGKLEKGQKVLLIEDVVNSGKSSLAGVQALREAGAVVEDCIAIFSYDSEKSKKGFSERKCNLRALTSMPVLIDAAKEGGYVSSQEYEMLMDWRNSPLDWAKRTGLE